MYYCANGDRSGSMAVLKMAQRAQVFPDSAEAQLRLADIKKLHLEYLRSDRNESNIKLRKDLEDMIMHYLTIVHHKEKFPCTLFREILRQTIETKHDFDAYQVALAFKALEIYAFNLIGQPWRKEYHIVRLYCGYFKYHVDRWLINARYVLEMMGYEPVNETVVTLQEPIDPDHVIVTSLNCLIAAVECQIMTQIYEMMNGRVSWQEISHVRRHHVGDVKKAFLLLNTPKYEKSDKHTRSFSEDRSRFLDNTWYIRDENIVDVPTTYGHGQMYSPSYNHRLNWETVKNPENFRSAVTNGHDLSESAMVPKSADEHIAESYLLVRDKKKPSKKKDMTREDCWSYVDRSLDHQGYCRDRGERGDLLRRTSGLGKQKSVDEILRDKTKAELYDWALTPEEPVNTKGDLIQFDRAHPWGHNAAALYQPQNVVMFSPGGFLMNHQFPTDLTRAMSTLSMSSVVQDASRLQSAAAASMRSARKDGVDSSRKSSGRNSWYDNVPSSSSARTLGDPLMYQTTATASPAHYLPIHSISNEGTRRSSQQRGYHTVPAKYHHPHPAVKETISTEVQTDVVDGGLGPQRPHSAGGSSSMPRESRRGHEGSSERTRASSEEKEKSESSSVTAAAAAVASGRWSCRACTYYNAQNEMVCEMCSRSRAAGPENEPLTTGGLHCEKCTLVNEKGATECIACATSLENSPTYV